MNSVIYKGSNTLQAYIGPPSGKKNRRGETVWKTVSGKVYGMSSFFRRQGTRYSPSPMSAWASMKTTFGRTSSNTK